MQDKKLEREMVRLDKRISELEEAGFGCDNWNMLI